MLLLKAGLMLKLFLVVINSISHCPTEPAIEVRAADKTGARNVGPNVFVRCHCACLGHGSRMDMHLGGLLCEHHTRRQLSLSYKHGCEKVLGYEVPCMQAFFCQCAKILDQGKAMASAE